MIVSSISAAHAPPLLKHMQGKAKWVNAWYTPNVGQTPKYFAAPAKVIAGIANFVKRGAGVCPSSLDFDKVHQSKKQPRGILCNTLVVGCWGKLGIKTWGPSCWD